MLSAEAMPSGGDTTPLRLARVAGWLYLAIIVCGVAGEALLRAPLVEPGDAERTAHNLALAATSFRFSIMLDVAMAVSDVALAVVLYALLEPVSRVLSLAALAFRLVQAAILGLNLVDLHRAVTFATSSLPSPERGELVMQSLDGHAMGYDVGLFFFGINCLLVGALLHRSGFVPKPLGPLMVAAGLVYLTGSTLHVVVPQAVAAFAFAYVLPLIAELSLCLWLIVKRVDGAAWLALSEPRR